MAKRPIITEDDGVETQEIKVDAEVVNDEVVLEEVKLEEEPKKEVKKPTVTKPTTAKPAEPVKETKPKPAPAKPKLPEPVVEEKPEVEEADEEPDTTTAEEVVPQNDTGMVASKECSFSVDVDKFAEFIASVAFDGVMDDAFIIVKNNKLYCNAAEAVGTQVVAVTEFSEIENVKDGTLIISKISRLASLLKLFKGKITVTYSNGFISITSPSKDINILGEAQGYVSSYAQLNGVNIDIENKVIGTFVFKNFSSFDIKKSSLAEIWTTMSTINIDTATFKVAPISAQLKITCTDGRDSANLTVPIENASIKQALETKFSKYLKPLVNTLVGNTATIWLSDICMVVKQNSNHYVIMATLTE